MYVRVHTPYYLTVYSMQPACSSLDGPLSLPCPSSLGRGPPFWLPFSSVLQVPAWRWAVQLQMGCTICKCFHFPFFPSLSPPSSLYSLFLNSFSLPRLPFLPLLPLFLILPLSLSFSLSLTFRSPPPLLPPRCLLQPLAVFSALLTPTSPSLNQMNPQTNDHNNNNNNNNKMKLKQDYFPSPLTSNGRCGARLGRRGALLEWSVCVRGSHLGRP